MEYLKACKRCNALPKLSNLTLYGDSSRSSHSVTCCTTITAKSAEEAMYKWNQFNLEAKDSYYYNRVVGKWEKVL